MLYLVAIFKMDCAVRRIGSEAAMTGMDLFLP